MKTFIPVYGSLMTIDHDNDDVKKVASNVSTCIDYAYIAPEDGKVNGKEIHEGDLILLMYPYPDEFGKRDLNNRTVIVISKDDELTKYIIGRIETDKKRKEYAAKADCCEACNDCCKSISAN